VDQCVGRRRPFLLRILDDRGSYPPVNFRSGDALFVASSSVVYTVVPPEEPNEYGFSEIAWANVAEIRLWGAIALAIEEGKGFYHFYPLEEAGTTLWVERLDEESVRLAAERSAARAGPQSHNLHWVKPNVDEIGRLYEALKAADNVLLRGVSCYLKSHLFWRTFFMEEMGFNLYIALEAGLTVIRKRLSAAAKRDVSFDDVFKFVGDNFAYGEDLAEYWKDCHDDRNALLHPDSDFGAYVMHPMDVDAIYEMFDPMLSLYRFLLLGERRPML
jgi:hypothetical protein